MILNANALHIPLADNSVQCVVTSPPYYGLRDYGTARWDGGDPECDHLQINDTRDPKYTKQTQNAGTSKLGYKKVCGKCGAVRVDNQIGLEQTPEEYVANLVAVFREVKRVLREDGTCWVNLGDSYATSPNGRKAADIVNDDRTFRDKPNSTIGAFGAKAKDLLGVPWRVAFALQADGWYLRSDIIWSKPNPMPESVTDRPTKAHEYVFLLTKSPRYYFDQDAVRETSAYPEGSRDDAPQGSFDGKHGNGAFRAIRNTRNIRSVWTIATQPTSYAHFATFPEKLVEPCIKAGTSEKGCCPKCGKPWVRVVEKGESMWEQRKAEGAPMRKGTTIEGLIEERKLSGAKHAEWKLDHPDKFIGWQPACACDAGDPVPCVVFDPFAGSGTVERVAIRLRRRSIGTELNYRYISEIVSRRTADIQPTIF